MTLQDLAPLLVPLALDWIWDKLAARRAEKQAQDAIGVIKSSLSEMGEAGDRVSGKIDAGMARLAVTTGRWSRRRWSVPPNGKHDTGPISVEDARPGKRRRP